MGWMTQGRHSESRNTIVTGPLTSFAAKEQPTTTHVETRSSPTDPSSISDDQLPFIDASRVTESRRDGLLWIVIDDIVYDCTLFAEQHPGGRRVLEFFNGTNCSWQFWRFHSKKDMEEYGRSLRIGCTSGVPNKFNERPRFVGLRRHAA